MYYYMRDPADCLGLMRQASWGFDYAILVGMTPMFNVGGDN